VAPDNAPPRTDSVLESPPRRIAVHAAWKQSLQVPGLDGRTTNRPGDRLRQGIRKRVEDFGGIQTVNGLRRIRHPGWDRTLARIA